ncbi:formylglycine-generating enzyme family protein [Candidatus Electrothrix sp.]|uniref:formylglycine-generating enzyme family protein n=1 Tax=Candidatus Electrothrix sp. TaxID=2170559 RepID=UPI004057A349
MRKNKSFSLLHFLAGASLLLASNAVAADRVVVIPLGGTVGNATAADVVKGKTFSSKAAGKGATGTLEQHPMGQSYTNTIGMTFNLIPSGTFTMGSPDGEPGRDSTETQHQVTLTESFYMQTTEVTQKQWQDLIDNNPSDSNPGDNYPVETVNWFEAAHFANALSVSESRSECYTLTGCSSTPGNDMECSSVDISDTCTGYRLPTEAQWEYAARATTTAAYANPVFFDSSNTEIGSGFNTNLHAMGWYWYNNEMKNSSAIAAYESGTKPVAVKQANKWGLFDMHGNVWEWCQDWWDGSSAYSADPVTDPQGDATGSNRVIRGGGWSSVAWNARSADRIRYSPGNRYYLLGFRLVLPPGQ